MHYHHSPPKFKHAKLVILFSQLAAHARVEPIAKLATITNCISLIQRTTNAKFATISYLSAPPAFQHTYASLAISALTLFLHRVHANCARSSFNLAESVSLDTTAAPAWQEL
jgi:hypothetical protein